MNESKADLFINAIQQYIDNESNAELIDGNTPIILIEGTTYSYSELKEIIEKANMYDDLCK